MTKSAAVTLLYALLIGLLLALGTLELPVEVPVRVIQAALVIAFTLCAWAFGLLAEPLPTLAFFLLVVLFGIAPANVVFSGFSSTAWWLVFGGSVLGAAINTTGLGGASPPVPSGAISVRTTVICGAWPCCVWCWRF
ncbi:hypothetical protein LRS56_14940 [Pseudomonas poae]|nr:hypothetical protein LRS56_14940 [Pseudomonas poae]